MTRDTNVANAQIIAPPAASRALPYIVLVIALVAASVGLISIRIAMNNGVPSLVVVTGRMAIAVACFTPFVLHRYRPVLRGLTRRDWGLLVIAGLLFAGDLAMFAESLKHTSVLLATVVGGLSPLWTALLERFILKTPLHRAVYIGLSLALAGGVMLALAGSGNSDGLGSNPLLGGVLALSSGLSAALYLIVARSLRPHIPLLPYIWLVFAVGSLLMLTIAFAAGFTFTGYTQDAYFWVLASTIISQLIAHPSFSFVVGYLSPTFISISAHSITVMASVMAFIFFQEIPGIGQLLGSVVILLGVSFAITGQSELRRS